MTLFHLTKRANIGSIRRYGIIPNFTKGFAKNKAYNGYCVWLTDSPIFIIENQIGEKYFKRHDVIILKVDIKELNMYSKICHNF